MRLLPLFCCAATLSCLERPFETAPLAARTQVDRTALADVLLPPPEGASPVGANFGNAAELLAYKLEPPQMVPGQRTKLTLYWRCKAELEQWHVFVHLDDASGNGERIHAEHDPAQGRFPTEAWKPGDLIADPISFVVGRGGLMFYLGLFSQGETRLPLTSVGRGRDDGSNRLLAGVLPLAK